MINEEKYYTFFKCLTLRASAAKLTQCIIISIIYYAINYPIQYDLRHNFPFDFTYRRILYLSDTTIEKSTILLSKIANVINVYLTQILLVVDFY